MRARVSGPRLTVYRPAPAAPFDPTQITGCITWLDASNAGSITSSGGLVSQWNDLSGAGNHATQAVGVNQPSTGTRTQNSLNVIEFSNAGASTYMQSNLDASSRTQTVFVVLLSDVDTAAGTAYSPISTLQSGGRQIQFCGFGVDRFRFNKGGVAALSVYDGVDPAASTAYVLMCAIGSSNVIWSLNAAAEETDSDSTTLTASCTTIIGADASGGGAAQIWDGWLAEIVVYNTQLGSTDRGTVRDYLRTKWGTA